LGSLLQTRQYILENGTQNIFRLHGTADTPTDVTISRGGVVTRLGSPLFSGIRVSLAFAHERSFYFCRKTEKQATAAAMAFLPPDSRIRTRITTFQG